MGWEQLENILDDNRAQVDLEKQESITKCPDCAFIPLKENNKGIKLCPICGWTGR